MKKVLTALFVFCITMLSWQYVKAEESPDSFTDMKDKIINSLQSLRDTFF